MLDELKEYQDNGGFVLLDSGNYEKLRLKNTKWQVQKLWEVLKKTPHN